MKIGLVGLGRMGGAMARRLADQGHSVVAWDLRARAIDALGNTIEPAKHPRLLQERLPACRCQRLPVPSPRRRLLWRKA